MMPDACGIALGFDRLVMLATGTGHGRGRALGTRHRGGVVSDLTLRGGGCPGRARPDSRRAAIATAADAVAARYADRRLP